MDDVQKVSSISCHLSKEGTQTLINQTLRPRFSKTTRNDVACWEACCWPCFFPTCPLTTQIPHTTLCLLSANSNTERKQLFEMNTEELQVANVEATPKSLDKADTANTIAAKSNTIAAFSVAISALLPLLIAYVANNKMDTMRMEDQIFQTSWKEREEIFQLERKKLETSNEKKA